MSDCILWNGSIDANGYGRIGSKVYAHIEAYKSVHGEIPPGLVIDHTCHDRDLCPGGTTCPHRRCVEVGHMELVTIGENVRRGSAARNSAKVRREKLECKWGHLLVGDNLYIRPGNRNERGCRTCRDDAARRFREKKREQNA